MFILSLKPELLSTLFSDFDPALLQALRCTCRLFRDSVTLDMCDQSVARTVARYYTRATILRMGWRDCEVRIHSRYGQHVADFHLQFMVNQSGQNMTLFLNGMEFDGWISDNDRLELLGDFPVWISSVVLDDNRVNMLIHAGVSKKNHVFYAPMFN